MFEGNTVFPVTGIPIRKIACMISPLADADPVPLAAAILTPKSLGGFINKVDSRQLPVASDVMADALQPAPDGTHWPSIRTDSPTGNWQLETENFPAHTAISGITVAPAYGIWSTNFRMSQA